jgi:hypothetical protein
MYVKDENPALRAVVAGLKLRISEDLDKKGLRELIVAASSLRVERRCRGCTGRNGADELFRKPTS